MGVHVDGLGKHGGAAGGAGTVMSSATVKNGGLGPLLPNGLTIPVSSQPPPPHQQLKNGQAAAAGGAANLNGNANQPQASPKANGHRNGGINSSLDSSKDDSFTDIDVESVDNPKELLASEGRPPLNNVTTNINNGSSNGVGGGKSVDNNVQPAPAVAPAVNAATPAPAVPQTAAAALINSQEEDAKDWSPYYLGDMPLPTWLLAVKKYVLTPLIRHPRSLAFRKPVDAKALGIFPIYNQVITRPMDLGTVKDKVDKKLYNSKAVVLSDIDLVWNNALKFNPTGHEVHEAAAFLQKHTLGHCLKAMVASGGSLTSSTAAASAPLHTPVRATGIREARKKAPVGLPGEYDDLKPQHLEQKYAANLSPPLKACDNILRSLMLSQPHWEFVEPFMKASRPGGMCFGVIQDRMRSYHYTTSMEFANDVRRIVTETYKHAPDPEEDFKCKQAGKLLVEFERQFAANVKNDDEVAQTRAWAIQSDPFIQKLVRAQDLIVSMNTGVDRLVQDYEVLKVAIKARKEASRRPATQQPPAAKRRKVGEGSQAAPSRKRAPSSGSSPVKKPAAKRPKTSPAPPNNSRAAPKQQKQPQKQQKQQQQQQPPAYHQSALNAVSKKPTPEQIGAWIGMLEDSKQENLLEILRSNGENIEVDADGSVELSLETWSQKTLDEVELFLRREIPSEQSQPQQQQQQKQQQKHNSSKAEDSSSSDSSSSDSESSSSDSSEDEDE